MSLAIRARARALALALALLRVVCKRHVSLHYALDTSSWQTPDSPIHKTRRALRLHQVLIPIVA